MRLIDADELSKTIKETCLLAKPWDYVLIEQTIADAPTIEERKKGKWIETDDGWDGTYFVCSNCGCPWTLIDGDPRDNDMNYCPNCGADMRGET